MFLRIKSEKKIHIGCTNSPLQSWNSSHKFSPREKYLDK